jgi:hypothetical protein
MEIRNIMEMCVKYHDIMDITGVLGERGVFSYLSSNMWLREISWEYSGNIQRQERYDP